MDDKEIEAIRHLNNCVRNNIPLPEEALSWFKTLLNLVDKLQKENEELKDEIELHKADENTLQDLIREDEENINKLINYIAVRENKDYEDIRKEFDI